MIDFLILMLEGFYCFDVKVYIDLVWFVVWVMIIYGYVDYVWVGYGVVLVMQQMLDIMVICYGINFCDQVQVVDYGEKFFINGVDVLFYLVGYVFGLVQICLFFGGEMIVVLGDYKCQFDLICVLFEVF